MGAQELATLASGVMGVNIDRVCTWIAIYTRQGRDLGELTIADAWGKHRPCSHDPTGA
jgi:hypothetical protein